MTDSPRTPGAAEWEADFRAYWAGDCEICRGPRKEFASSCSAAHMDVALYHSGLQNARYRMALEQIQVMLQNWQGYLSEADSVAEIVEEVLNG